MAPQGSCLFSLLILLLLQQIWTLRIENAARNENNTTTLYRVSLPQIKQAVQRVPLHLQDIRPGFVDDDAGDVIRIIEPPQHFQQLKRQLQHQPQPAAVIWQQPRKLSTNRAKPKLPANGDLLTQESQHVPQFNNNLQLPMEILASVRKTERLLQRQRQKQPPLLRQRHIQRQTHTLIAQQSLERELYQRGQQQRLRAALQQQQREGGHKRTKRVKRESRNSSSSYNVAEGLKLVAHIGELLQNATRYLPDDNSNTTTTEAIEAATTTTDATNCDKRRRRQRLFRQQGARKTPARGRNFRHEATTATTTTTTETTTANLTTSATPLASRLVNSRQSSASASASGNRNLPVPSSRSDDSVLYADVMSTIRNLWQEHDHPVAPPQSHSDYSALDVYLRELDAIAKKLPNVSPIPSLPNDRQFLPATPPNLANWYLINNEGLIYETQLDSQTKPSAALFHLFPDMPKPKNPITTLDLE